MKTYYDFDEIRPYYDEEIHQKIEGLLEEPMLQKIASIMLPNVDYSTFKEQMLSYNSKIAFQKGMMAPILFDVAKKTATSLDLSGTEFLNIKSSYTFISNHRDILLDAAFLNILLIKADFNTSEIAIGDNLLIYKWIEDLVRINKSFLVKRDVSVRKMLEVSKRLSTYIHFAVKIKNQSVWIAQREGRAKDADDRTQGGLLKMLSMGGNSTLTHNLLSLNITPLCLSYEYDPCDFLKAKEYQLKRDNPEYKKEQRDDLVNMETGLFGFKGNIHFQITPPINDQIAALPISTDKNETICAIGELIDKAIHKAYRIYPGNYVALDLLENSNRMHDHYTGEEKTTFTTYLEKQLSKIDIPDKDETYLKMKILEMYANPLKNQLAAQ